MTGVAGTENDCLGDFRLGTSAKIRPASRGDASRIAEILVFAKRVNYRRIFRDDDFSFGELQVLPVVREFLEDDGLLSRTWVYENRFVRGVAIVLGHELVSLYVDPLLAGEGVGGELLEFAKGSLGVRFLWVLEDNERAVAFYERHGFARSGEWRYEGSSDVREVRMGLERFVAAGTAQPK